jgi:hypothetical protein
MYFTDELTDKTSLWKKLLSIISSLSVSLSIINLLMDLQTDKAFQNFFLPASFYWYFPLEVCHITDKNTICNFINIFICLFIYQSVNITYHRYNTICNSIKELAVAVTLVVILFQLSGIYRRMWSLGNHVRNIFFKKTILNRSSKIIKIKYIKIN